MRPIALIGIVGPKGVGKSFLAAYIKSNLLDVTTLSFATPLKRMIETILPKGALTEGKEDVNYGICGKTPRQLMQSLGTDWARKMVSDNIWVDIMEKLIDDICDSVVIDDVRFVNEVEMVKRLGGIIILCKRGNITFTGEHASEEAPINEVDADVVVDYDEPNWGLKLKQKLEELYLL